MDKLTHEQMAWALQWAAQHLEEHDIKGEASKELLHCAKHFQESHDRSAADKIDK